MEKFAGMQFSRISFGFSILLQLSPTRLLKQVNEKSPNLLAGLDAVMCHRSKLSAHRKIAIGTADEAAGADAPVARFGMKFMAG